MRHILLILLMTSSSVWADTIERYMNIVNNIPQMEMKADQQSQAWARSARNVVILTSESVAESLMIANETATRAGKSLFCLPANVQLNAEVMNQLIQQTYGEISSQDSDKNKMTVSQVALMGISKQYPCRTQQTREMQRFNQALHHVSG